MSLESKIPKESQIERKCPDCKYVEKHDKVIFNVEAFSCRIKDVFLGSETYDIASACIYYQEKHSKEIP